MDPPPAPEAATGAADVAPDTNKITNNNGDAEAGSRPRRESLSQRSEDSQTAADFIRDQMQLEADAREALPYVGTLPNLT